LLFLWSDTCTGKTLQRLAVNHAVPAVNQAVIVAFNFISERTVYEMRGCHGGKNVARGFSD
jgi:hypothetical protein